MRSFCVNVVLYALLVAYVVPSLRLVPPLVEARIHEFSAIQANLVRLSLARRSLGKSDPPPTSSNTPQVAGSKNQPP
ncbi:hypothetical protein REPUB_Repub06bG0050000 [Reevesia pubescens]